MSSNGQNQRQTHARRRVNEVSHTTRSSSQSTQRNTNPAKNAPRGTGSSISTGSSGYRFRAGEDKIRRTSNAPAGSYTPHKTVTSLTPAEEKKQARRERREIAERRREEKWQNEVVRIRGGIDICMLVLILVLIALGTITVFSASYPYAVSKGYDPNYFSKRQVIFVLVGLAIMTAQILFIPVNFYKNKVIVWGAYGVSLILLLITPFMGNAEGEAVRWFSIGPINVQPSELMKVSMILILSWYLGNYEKQIKQQSFCGENYKYNIVYPFLIMGIGCGAVLFGKHLSGTIIIGLIAVAMLIVGGCKMKWIFATGLPIGSVIVGVFLALNPYALKRITTFTGGDEADILDELYQTTQSLYAIGSGGLFGVGLGQSRQKYSYLTQAHTDFIFSIWCEEWGFLGALVLIILFILFIWRGYVIALRAPDKFTTLMAFGITTHVGLQAMLNMCVASNMIMNTGITLPFFSYGGSSIVVLLAEMGILLSISRQYYKKKSDLEHEEMMRRLGLGD